MTAAQDEVRILRAAATLLLEQADLVPAGPWRLRQVVGRTAVVDTAGRIIAWIPDAAGTSVVAYIASRDPGSAQPEAALLTALADEAETVLKLRPLTVPAELAWRVSGYAEALGLARYLLREAAACTTAASTRRAAPRTSCRRR